MRLLAASLSILVTLEPALAADRFVEVPTQGLDLPATSYSGVPDATSVVQNPANMMFLPSWHLAGVGTVLDEDTAEGPGTGFGMYAALPIHLPFGLPGVANGIAYEQLVPPRLALAPDPGRPWRLTLSHAFSVSPHLAFGLSYHRLGDPNGGVLDGVNTIDLGVAGHLGAHLGYGLVVRDINTPTIAGVPVQRRYQAELTWRPTGTSALELGLFTTMGERRWDTDVGGRLAWRFVDGITLTGELASLTRDRLIDPAFDAGGSERDTGVRGSVGLAVSFGQLDLVGFGTFGRGVADETRALGGTGMVRYSGDRRPALIGQGQYMARVELDSALSGEKLTGVLVGLSRLARDPDCKAVLVIIGNLEGGYATLEELRAGFVRLRKAGKKVVVTLVAGTGRQYYVAAAADHVILDAAGGLRLVGLSGSAMYYKRMFEMLGIVAQFEKYAEFKSAPEAYTREGPTPEAEMVKDALFDDLYGRFVDQLARDRKKSAAEMRAIIDAGPYTAEEAGKVGLVDQVVEGEDMDAAVARALGGRLYPLGSPPSVRDGSWQRPRIAVVYVDGDIIDGESRKIPLLGMKLVGGDTIAESIQWARENDDIEAVIIRIDSPGGSALASELMAREVKATRAVKPVIVSMGDLAASGGYFAAAHGELIYAMPGTITGSIGIFTGKIDVSGLMAKLGITIVTENRGAHADMESLYRPYTDEERARLHEKLGYYYRRFLTTVAQGRKRSIEDVDKVARGRVWTGAQALGVGLVDREGGIVEALIEAKRRAGFGEDDLVELVSLPDARADLLTQVLKLAGGGQAGATVELTDLPGLELLRSLPMSILLAPPGSALARLPYAVDWGE
jgi:protease-4